VKLSRNPCAEAVRNQLLEPGVETIPLLKNQETRQKLKNESG